MNTPSDDENIRTSSATRFPSLVRVEHTARNAPLFARAPHTLTAALLIASAAGCLPKQARVQGPRDEPSKSEEPSISEEPAPRPSLSKICSSATWSAFPGTPAQAPLQEVFAVTVRALAAGDKDALCSQDASKRGAAVRKGFGWLGPMLASSWSTAAKQLPELERLGNVVTATQLPAACMPAATASDALAWLATELPPPEPYCKASNGGQRAAAASEWVLSMMAWATSPEAVYESAFEAFGRKWVRLETISNLRSPWIGQAPALEALRPWVLGTQSKAKRARLGGIDITPPKGAFVEIGTEATGIDVGSVGSGNGVIDGGERVRDIAVSIKARNAGEWLISESLVPTKIPSCMVVPWKEVVVPEVKAGDHAELTLPEVFVSSSCEARETLELQLVSSSGAQPVALSLGIRPSLPRASLLGVDIDVDLPGFSDPAKSREVIPTNSRAELRLLGALFGATDDATVAVDDPTGRIRFQGVTKLPFSPVAGGKTKTLDDLDLVATTSDADPLNALASEQATVWLRGHVRAVRSGASVQIRAHEACVERAHAKQETCEDDCDAVQVRCGSRFFNDPILNKSHGAERCRSAAATCKKACEVQATAACGAMSEGQDTYNFVRYLPVLLAPSGN